MAAKLTTYISLIIRSVLEAVSPVSGSVTHEMASDYHMGNGTGAYQADKTYEITLSVGTSGTEVDLQTATDVYGVALSLDEVVAIGFKADAANTANVNITGGATNKWEALLLATGDGLSIKPAMTAAFAAPLDGSLPVTSSAKTILAAAASGTQTVTILVTGRSQ